VSTTLPFTSDNPFYSPSELPLGAPPFDRIRDEHFQPAIEEGRRRHLAEVDAIASSSDAPTFDNTLVPLERSGDLLSRALRAFFGIAGANTNDTLQDIQTEEAPRLAAHNDAIYLNDRLFARIRSVYATRGRSGLNAEQVQLVERYHMDFVRAGATLGDADKARLREMNQEESTLTAEFQNRLLAGTKAGALIFDDAAELEGLSEGDLASAAEAAAQRGLPGRWVLTLQNTTQQPALESLRRRDVRERLYRASTHRTDKGDENDTRDIIRRIAQIRAHRAVMLGFRNTAAYTLDDQMAKTPEAALALLTKIGAVAAQKACDEAARIQALIHASGERFTLEPWDWQFYSEQVRRAEYDLDESQIKPYFELERVLRDGVFFAATQLYGINFVERHDLPVYHPDVRVYDVLDEDGSLLALFYTDFFKRDNKSGGAWMDAFVDQSRLLGRRAVIFNVTNFTKPAPGMPALLSLDDVTTLFHEFGHSLHGMLSEVEYPTLTGTNVPRDFVEFPSQFNEHWSMEPAVFANYAKHYETGDPMPSALVARIKKSRKFNQGFALTEYIGAAVMDMAWHTLPSRHVVDDIDAFDAAALARHGMDVPEVPPRYRSTYFAHIWDGGYGGGYYAYLWAEVLDHDTFAMFRQHGGFTRANGRRLREMILSRGGTRAAAELYRAYRGSEPEIEPLLVARGLKPEPDEA
jgi:peptidyl-dipeptidase Dcp